MDFANVYPISGFSIKIALDYFQFHKICVIRRAPLDFQTFRRYWRYLYDKIDSVTFIKVKAIKSLSFQTENSKIWMILYQSWKIHNVWESLKNNFITCVNLFMEKTQIDKNWNNATFWYKVTQPLLDVETNVKLLLQNKIFIMKTFLPSFHWCDSLKKIE